MKKTKISRRPPAAAGRLQKRLSAFRRCEDGVSALEFALFAPILFFSLLAMTDVGLALYERMTIDHVLRGGAQSAMADPGEASVCSVLQLTASKHFIVSGACDGAVNADALSLSVERDFACAEDPDVAVPPSTFCAASRAPNIYYRLSATKGYDGLFLPISIGRFSLGSLTLTSSAQVQIR